MKKTLIPLLLPLLFCTFLGQAKKRDWSKLSDFEELRKTIGWSDDFFKKCEKDRPTKELNKLMASEKWQKVVDSGRHWLNSCPIDISIHLYCGIAFEKLQKKDESEVHFQWVDGLMEAVMKSGDGKTAKTPIVTVSIAEEYDVLNILGLTPLGQSLINGEKTLDVLKVKDENSVEFNVYFYPEAHFHRLNQMFKDL